MRVILDLSIFFWYRFGKIIVFLILKKLCTLSRFYPPLKVGHIHHLVGKYYVVRYWWERERESRVQLFNDIDDVNGSKT